jgi:hypothetical protein
MRVPSPADLDRSNIKAFPEASVWDAVEAAARHKVDPQVVYPAANEVGDPIDFIRGNLVDALSIGTGGQAWLKKERVGEVEFEIATKSFNVLECCC